VVARLVLFLRWLRVIQVAFGDGNGRKLRHFSHNPGKKLMKNQHIVDRPFVDLLLLRDVVRTERFSPTSASIR
jgi:hypothetical protein